MWNAGVLGLPAQAVQRLDTVLALTDQLYRLYPKHVMEQLAFSQVLSQVGKLSAADACIHHYWRDKDEWNSRLADFFATHVDYAEARAQVPTLFRTPVPDAESERRKSWWKRFSF